MLNVKRKILTTNWKAADGSVKTTFGKINPVRMFKDGYVLIDQNLITYQISEEKFALTALSEERS